MPRDMDVFMKEKGKRKVMELKGQKGINPIKPPREGLTGTGKTRRNSKKERWAATF